MPSSNTLAELVRTHVESVLSDWMDRQLSAPTFRRELIPEDTLRDQSNEFLQLFARAIQQSDDADAPPWKPVKGLLGDLSRSRALQGFSASETATFVFSLKQPLFDLLRRELKDGPEIVPAIWRVSVLLDRLGLYTTEVYQQGREAVITRQQQELLELSTPVVKLWDGVVALPLIGTLDSARTQVVMETLLQRVVETEAQIAIIDITGVPTVDTLVAQHLLKTVAAARLMGVECVISGIRPQIAQTMVHLGVNLAEVITKATLADAFTLALQRIGATVPSAAINHERRA